MIEAIVTLVVPTKEHLVHGTGALLSHDYVETVEPAHTEVYRLEFEDEETMQMWLRNNKNYAASSELLGKIIKLKSLSSVIQLILEEK